MTGGAILQSPFYDEKVVSTLVRARPDVIFHYHRVKGIAHRVLRERLSADTLSRIGTTDPGAYLQGLVRDEVLPALRRPSSIQALSQLGILTREGLCSAMERLGTRAEPSYDLAGYLWRVHAAEAWLSARGPELLR